jgi:hypothetical protein
VSLRIRCLSAALALSLVGLPTASIAHEGHEHPDESQAAGTPAGDPSANAQSQQDAAAIAAKRKKMADEDAAKAKAAKPAPVPPRDDSGQH